jgi:hypothetical protein
MKSITLARRIFFFFETIVVSLIFAASNLPAQESSPAKTETATAKPAAMTADTEWDGVKVELISVTRGENDVTIKFKYTNEGSKTAEFYHSNYSHDNIAALVYYIDPKNKKKYLVIKDAEGNPIASLMKSMKLDANESKAGWAKLAAPPADTTAVTVVLPGAPPFEKAPIASQ